MFALRSGLLTAFLICIMFFLPGCGNEPAFKENHALILSSDVIIYGDSVAALSAALEAAEQGAAVIVFYEFSGDDQWLWEEGMLASNLPQSAEASVIEDEGTEAEEYENGSELTDRVHTAKLLSPETESDLAWFIEKNGLVMERKGPQLFTAQSHSYQQLYQQMIHTACRYGVRFFSSCRPVEILFNEDRVAGLLIKTGDKIRKAFAPSVILADGGYLGNKELMETWAPGVDIASWRENRAGFGMQLAVSLDLDLADLAHFACYPAVRIGAGLKRESLPSRALLITGEQGSFIDGLSRHEIIEELRMNEGPAYLLVAEAQLEDGKQLKWPRFLGIDDFMRTNDLDMPHLKHFFTNPSGYFRGVEVITVAEYCLGGIEVNKARLALYHNKPVSGLYIAGELACSLQGRYIIPGAALTEEIVTGRIAGRNAALYSQR